MFYIIDNFLKSYIFLIFWNCFGKWNLMLAKLSLLYFFLISIYKIKQRCWLASCVVRKEFLCWVRPSLAQDVKSSSCCSQCNVLHQWMAQRQVCPVSVYCDCVGCHVLCMWHDIQIWPHNNQSITAKRRARDRERGLHTDYLLWFIWCLI